jgi:DNA mismatch repair protein MutS
MREYLDAIYDLERLMGRVSYKSANPRDLIAFKNSLSMLPHIKYQLQSYKTPLMQELYETMDEMEDIYQLIDDSIAEEPPIVIREGGIIKEGFNEEIDNLRKALTRLSRFVARLREEK